MLGTIVDTLKPSLALVIRSDLDACGVEPFVTFVQLDVDVATSRHVDAVPVAPLVEAELILFLRLTE